MGCIDTMDLSYYLALIVIIFIFFAIAYYFKGGLIYAGVIVFSLLGLVLSLNSPIDVPTGKNFVYTDNTTGYEVVETQYYQPQVINIGITLLFIASLFVAVILWSNDGKEEEF